MDSIYISNPQLTFQSHKNSYPHLMSSQVREAYDKLHQNINEMQTKVQNVISKHESEFMLAYRTHMTKIKRELGEIKKRSEDQERMFSANDRIKFLEKEIAVFREEAIAVYDKLEKTTSQLQLYKRKYQQISRMHQLAQRDMKQSIKITKNVSASHNDYDKKIQELENKLQEKERQIQRMTVRREKREGSGGGNLGLGLGSIGSERSQYRYDSKLESSKIQTSSRKSFVPESSYLVQNNFRDIFFKCVKAVKKDIALRKDRDKISISFNYSLKDKDNISIEQFREIDKMRVMQLFFSDPGMEMWMYEKLFPNEVFRKLQGKEEATGFTGGSRKLFQMTSGGFALPKVRESQRKNTSKLQTKNKSFL